MNNVDLSVIQPLLQKALNMMETVACWERKAAKRAHIVGLQGEKRRLRYLSRNASNIVDWMEHYTFDIFTIDISPQAGMVNVTNLVCAMSTMNGIIEKLWTIYIELRKLVNEFIVAGFKDFGDPLDCYAKKLFGILGELERAAKEYEKAEYEYHHISRYQVSYYNVHDEYEKEEESQGYKDYHGM